MKELDTEALFRELDENYKLHYDGETFWKKLHALDNELDRMSLETFHKDPANAWSSAIFKEGQENTLVIRLKHEKAVEQLALPLTAFFRDTGVRFVPEIVVHGGKTVYQLRSNIDKAQWSRLAVFCKYRFEREILDKDEQKKLKKECHAVVTRHLNGICEWDGATGLPACISLMGTPGLLRPANPNEADPERKYEEINGQHPHGTPLIYRGKVVHVALKKDGTITGIPTAPYEYYFDMERHLLARSVEGVPENQSLLWILWDATKKMLTEATGLNFLAREVPLANRILRAGIVGVSAWAFISEGRTEPFVCLAIGEAGLIVAYVHGKWKSYGTEKQLQKNPAPLVADINAASRSAPIKRDLDKMLQEAWKPEKRIQLKTLLQEENQKLPLEGRIKQDIIESIVASDPKRVEDPLTAHLYGTGGFGGLFRK